MQPAHLQELIVRSIKNDMQAFRIIVEGHQTLVYSVAFRILCNEADAKDITQETFIKVWKHLSSFNSEMKFTTWLYTIAMRLCFDRLKTQKRRNTIQRMDVSSIQDFHFQSAEDIEKSVINADLGKYIQLFTEKLTPKQKLVFTLRDLEGIEVDDIQKITGLSAEKIKSNLYLARQFIRAKLENL